MPRDLNPESVKAACQAMRTAYRPDSILLRPDAMEAAIHAFLAAEEARGWAMRPRVATEGMKMSGWGAVFEPRENEFEDVWTAMWDAGAKP